MKVIIESLINEKNLRLVIGLLIFLIPAFAVVIKHGASYPHGYLSLLTLAILPFYRYKNTVTKAEQYLLAFFLMFSVWPFISWYIGEPDYFGTKSLGVYIRWLMFIPVYFLLRRLHLSINWLMFGLVTGAIGAGAFAIIDIVFELESVYPNRASGATNPIFFGNLSLLMGLMALSFWPVCKSRYCLLVLIAALFFGLIASLLSGSRGGWLAIPFLLMFIMWQMRERLTLWNKLIIIALVIALPVAVYCIAEFGIEQRILMLRDDYINYIPGELTNTALGLRLEVWNAAISMFLANPIIGVGLGDFITEIELLLGQPIPDKYLIFYLHAHNEYLSAMAERGIVGLLVVLSVLIYPALIYYKQLNSQDDEIRALSYSGMTMVIGFAIFSLSDISLSRSIYVSFYSCCTLFITATIYTKLTDGET